MKVQTTVVIPNYNGIKYIEGCLDSLLGGTMVPEIIVVDNASTDGSRELIEEKYPQVLLLKLSANTGFCHAVNAGIHLTRTRYVILLNNDIRADERFVEELHAAISQDGRAFSAQAKMLSMNEPDTIDDAGDLYCAFGWAFARGKGAPAAKYNHKGRIFSSCAGAAIYRMSVFEEIGLFDERHFCYLEDVDICYRAKIFGYRNLYAPKAVVYHAGSAATGSRHNPFKEEMTAGNNFYLLYKNMPALQYGLNLPLIKAGIAIKRSYFDKKGLKEPYEKGLLRGELLCARAMEQEELEREELPYKKDSIPKEAGLSSYDEAQEKVKPLYLAQKVPFLWGNLPNYVKIQLELWGNCFLRLKK